MPNVVCVYFRVGARCDLFISPMYFLSDGILGKGLKILYHIKKAKTNTQTDRRIGITCLYNEKEMKMWQIK